MEEKNNEGFIKVFRLTTTHSREIIAEIKINFFHLKREINVIFM